MEGGRITVVTIHLPDTRSRGTLMGQVHRKKDEAQMGRFYYETILLHWFGVTTSKDLTAAQCDELCGRLDEYQRESEDVARKAEEELENWTNSSSFDVEAATEAAERAGGVVRLDGPPEAERAAEGTRGVAEQASYWRAVRGG